MTAPHTPSVSPIPADAGGLPWGKIALVLLLAGMGYGAYMRLHSHPAAAPHFGMGQGPIPVAVVTMAEQKERLWTSFSARLTAVEQAEIRPQVGGRITKVSFTEGAWVRKGQPLFVIDPRPYRAQVNRAEAAVAAAETKLHLAGLELDRARSLIAKQAIAQRTLEERESDFDVAQSDVQAARAQLLQASVNLDYAYIEAPISGRVGRPEVTVGNVVEVVAARAAPLTTVVDTRTLYAEFNVDEDTYVTLTRQRKTPQDKLPVRMTLGTSGDRVYEGYLSAFDNSFNTSSGTIRARAVFDNKDGTLVPGLFAAVSLGSAEEMPVLTLPETAINTDQTKKFVYLVDADNKASYREVTLGSAVEGGRVVTSGLAVGDRVVLSGLQRLRPGAVVQPLTPFDKTGLVPPAGETPPSAAPVDEAIPAPAPETLSPALDAVFKTGNQASTPAAPAPKEE